MDVLPGRPRENTDKILARIAEAGAAGVKLIVFPEMAVPGYLLGDEWERASFLRECEACGETIRNAARDLVVMFGNVAVDWTRKNEDGRPRKFNALFTAEAGRFIGPEGGPLPFVIKTLMPNYREFDDSRHFFDTVKLAVERECDPRSLISPVPTSVGRIGAVLCEDAWDMDYALSPLRLLAGKGMDFAVNASCSPSPSTRTTSATAFLPRPQPRSGVP